MTTLNPDSPSKSRVFRIATRKSPLALWQAEFVADQLREKSIQTELIPLVSVGDVDMRPIDGTRQVGLFTKRIQEALVHDEADIAVHSLKDLPTEPDPRFALAAIPPREIVNDCLVSVVAKSLVELPQGAKVGTGSRRRAAQLLSQRPDLDVQPIRGNVQTRLSKLDSGEFDAVILAQAGLLRLNLDDVPATPLSLDQMLPAPGQGALGIETRSDDVDASAAVGLLDHLHSRASVVAERKLLSNLHGGCLAPIAAFAKCDGNRIEMTAKVLATDGSEELCEVGQVALEPEDDFVQAAQQLADQLSEKLIHAGAKRLIEEIRD